MNAMSSRQKLNEQTQKINKNTNKKQKELNANYYWMIIMDNQLYFKLERFEIVCSKNGAFGIRDANGRMKNDRR